MVRRFHKPVLLALAAASLWVAGLVSSEEPLMHRGANPHLANGATALTLRHFDEGIRHTQRGLDRPAKRRDRAAALSNLCAGFDGQQDYEQALAHCNAALEIDDDNWQAYNNRALAHLGLGELDQAQLDIDRGLELNPKAKELRRVQALVDLASKPKSN